MQTTVTIAYNEAEMTVTGDYSPLVAARRYGHAEHCHPEEGGEFDIERIEIGGTDVTGLLLDAYYPAAYEHGVGLGAHLLSRIADLAYDAAVAQANDALESDDEDRAEWRMAA